MNEAVSTSFESYLSKVVEKAVEQAVLKAVNKCFESNFARLTATLEVLNKDKCRCGSSSNATTIEKHNLIDSEEQLEQFNIDLRDATLQAKYVSINSIVEATFYYFFSVLAVGILFSNNCAEFVCREWRQCLLYNRRLSIH